ncbi:MAG: hypothetical protein ACK5KV_14230 [Bacteroides graminisolvens]|uniref:hypothetical protein n=1 Tax=Bacteroides graminisolvens TaxID=477666 RepID=UPI003A89AB95
MRTTNFTNHSDDKRTLTIKANRLGSVEEIISFLNDIEKAYNGVLCFERNIESILSSYGNSISLPLEILDYDIKEEDKLILRKISIQSPGFWELAGNLNPIQQIREFLKDHHERKKDRLYRMRQEKERNDLELEKLRLSVISDKIEMLESIGYPKEDIKNMVESLVLKPLEKLSIHQDNHLINDVVDDRYSRSQSELDY